MSEDRSTLEPSSVRAVPPPREEDDAGERPAPSWGARLRDALPGVRIHANLGGGNFKAQFRRADRSGARVAVVLGEDELARGVAQVKPLRHEAGQTECPLADLPAQLRRSLDS